jgi:vitamin B12 transporter
MFAGIVCSLLLMLFIQPHPVRAEECPLSEIVVTASKWEEKERDVTQGVTVITAKEIAASGDSFVLDLLRRQSDLNVVANGGYGKNATLFLRGGGGNQVLVLIDGVKINSPSSGSADLSGLLTDDVERIEIIKGPQSTLFGSEAMAGVVNIITRKGAGATKAGLSVEGGSFSTVTMSGSLSGGGEKGNYRLTASPFDTDGISVAKSGTEPDAYTNTSVSAKAGFTPFDRAELELDVRYTHEDSELDGYVYGTGLVDDLNWTQKRDAWLVSAKGSFSPFNSYEQKLAFSAQEEKLKSEDPDTAWNDSRINTNTYLVDWQHILYLEPLTLTGGFAFRNESAENKGKFDASADNRAGYLDGKTRLLDGALVVDAGVRYDSHESFGEAVTYRTGVLYNLADWGIRLKANHGTGFRAPSLNELYYPNYGNRNLAAEIILYPYENNRPGHTQEIDPQAAKQGRHLGGIFYGKSRCRH